MSSIEVSLLIPYTKMESGAERSTRRAQRPPPPPPPSRAPPIRHVQETPLYPTLETSVAPANNLDDRQTSLLSEFQRLFDSFDYVTVRNEILDRRMLDCNFATVLWRIFLHCLPRDSNQWTEMLDTSRRHYEKLVQTYKIDPYKTSDEHTDGKGANHPLSQDRTSFWGQYFADEELKQTITIDVRRTCPDISFFRNPRMIDLQLRILFTHIRHNEKTASYRQGMHEILGIVVYSLHMESVQVNDDPQSSALMRNLFDPQYLEHDAYAIFEKIMNHLRQFYSHSSNSPTMRKSASMNNATKIPFQRLNHVHIQTNELVTRMKSIFERLGNYDRLLHCKLEEWNIEPTVYGIRWLRLLFGREIPFESIPTLWTVIFCFDESFGFVDYFFIALLLAFGQIIENRGDMGHTDCLELLMKQNMIINVEPVIRRGLSLTGRQLQIVTERPAMLPVRRTEESQVIPVEKEADNTSRPRELQRVPIAPAPYPRLVRPNIPDLEKAISSQPANPASKTALNSTVEPSVFNVSTESELDLWSGKTMRQQYDDSLRLQKCCASYMNKFIERLQVLVCELQAPKEDELLIQISGLKQIANALDGRLTFDNESLEALLKYRREEPSLEPSDSDVK